MARSTSTSSRTGWLLALAVLLSVCLICLLPAPAEALQHPPPKRALAVKKPPPPLKKKPPPLVKKPPPPVKKPPPPKAVAKPTIYSLDWSWGVGFTTVLPVFKVGDAIKFSFDSSHNVFQLNNKIVYDSCYFSSTSGHEIGNYDANYDGTAQTAVTTFKFTAPGMYYFACSLQNHCNTGMKIFATVA